MADMTYNTATDERTHRRIDDTDLELYLNDATPQEIRHAAICVLHRLGELAPFDLRFYLYPDGDVARGGADRLMRALAPVCFPELRVPA